MTTLLLLAVLVAAPQSRIVLDGSSNVVDWRCTGTTLSAAMEMASSEDVSRFELRVPVTALRCGNARMERDMYRALRASEFPAIEFRFTGMQGGSVVGELSLAGARRTVTMPVKAERMAGDRVRVRATLPLRMTDFAITPPTGLFGMVKARDELRVELDLVLREE